MLKLTLGPYRIESELGSGGMGGVWLAEAVERCTVAVGTRVALKVVHPHLLGEPGFFKRFLREAEIGKAVAHANVVRCFDCDQLVVDGTTHNFLVMEYVEGQTLRELLADMEMVPEELCRHVGREVSKGLAAIHRAGVLHRDLKPENVMITRDQTVKIMDLGMARLADETVRLSQTGVFCGSLMYAAPEQFGSGQDCLDGRADLHALGVVLYELSSGRHPFAADQVPQVIRRILNDDARRLGEVNPQLSPFFEEAVHALLAKDRDSRFPSAGALLGTLEKGEDSDWWMRRAVALRTTMQRPLRRIRIPRETAVFGRDEELERLRAAFETAKAGQGQVVLIEGEAGVGKSRLADELIGRLQQQGEDLNFVFGGYPPGGAATASGAWSTAYREHFGAEGLEETLEPYLKLTPALIPAFAALLRGEPTPEGKEPLTNESIQTVFCRTTQALAEERPTVVLIEDLHFAPEEGRGTFAALSLALTEHRILLIGTTRPGLTGEWRANLDRMEHARLLRLSRLGPKDLARLLEDAFRSEHLAAELGHRISLKSDGNPFFVFEILRGLKEGGQIECRADGRWSTTGKVDDIEIPSSVLELTQARISHLGEDEQELLDVAACCGFEFDPTLVAAAAGRELIPALRTLGRVEKAHRLVRSSGRRFVFDHHQVQEALYRGISEPLREAYHARIGAEIERNVKPGADGPIGVDGKLYVELCDHFLSSSERGRALSYLDPALDHLEAGHLLGQMVEFSGRALSAPGLLVGEDRAELLIRRAECARFLGMRDELRSDCEEAMSLATQLERPDLTAKASSCLAVQIAESGQAKDARRILAGAIDSATMSGDKDLLMKVRLALGSVHWYGGDHEGARRQFGLALADAWEVGDRQAAARATYNTGLSFSMEGRVEEARACFQRSLEIARETGDRLIEASALANLGLAAFRAPCQLDKARENFEQDLEISRSVGFRRGEARAFGNLGIVFLSEYKFEEAFEYLERQISNSREIGYGRGVYIGQRNLAYGLFLFGRFEACVERARSSLELARRFEDREYEVINLRLGAIAAIARGRCREALLKFEASLAVAREISFTLEEALLLRSLSRLLEVFGNSDGASSSLRSALDLYEAAGRSEDWGSKLAEFRLEVLTGRSNEAIRILDEARDLREDWYSEMWHQPALDAGRLLLESGEREAAGSTLAGLLGTARARGTAGVTVLPLALMATLSGDAEAALQALREHEDRAPHLERMEARYLLWQVTGDLVHLEAAKSLLCYLRDHAPEEYRESMIVKVPLHRDITAAWAEHGGGE